MCSHWYFARARELADQVAKEVRKLARSIHNIKVLTLCGGMPFGPQIGSLEHGAHIIVGTPGRVEEHLRKGTLRLDSLNMLVLDEADRMLDMGFQPGSGCHHQVHSTAATNPVIQRNLSLSNRVYCSTHHDPPGSGASCCYP